MYDITTTTTKGRANQKCVIGPETLGWNISKRVMLCHRFAKVRNAYLKYAKDAIFEQGVYVACGSPKIVEEKVNVWASRREETRINLRYPATWLYVRLRLVVVNCQFAVKSGDETSRGQESRSCHKYMFGCKASLSDWDTAGGRRASRLDSGHWCKWCRGRQITTFIAAPYTLVVRLALWPFHPGILKRMDWRRWIWKRRLGEWNPVWWCAESVSIRCLRKWKALRMVLLA